MRLNSANHAGGNQVLVGVKPIFTNVAASPQLRHFPNSPIAHRCRNMKRMEARRMAFADLLHGRARAVVLMLALAAGCRSHPPPCLP
jgi:hypothetical protein